MSVQPVLSLVTPPGGLLDDPYFPKDRLPPQSLEAEQAVLAGIFIDPQAITQVVEIVKPKDFYHPKYHILYQGMLALFDRNEPIDIITLSEWLKGENLLEEIGGRGFINDVAMSSLTAANIVYYAEIVRDKSLLRQLVHAAGEIAATAYEETQAETAIDQAQQILFQVTQNGLQEDFTHIKDVLPVSFEQIEERHANKGTLMGTASGFYDLDQLTSGFQKSDLIILAARPSMGKTALCLNMATHVALRERKPVLVFSLEMSKEQIVLRMLCSEAEIDAQRIRTGEITEHDFQKLSVAMGKLGDASLYIDDSPALSAMEMRAKARKLMMETGGDLGLVVIDYLQLMEGPSAGGGGGDNRVQEISAISRGLKSLARELRVPVIALSQLSRAVESRQDKRPMLSDLRESGAIEQDADLVMFIYRDEYYNPDTDRAGTADVIIAKQRNGPVGNISLLFRHNYTKFLNPKDAKPRMF